MQHDQKPPARRVRITIPEEYLGACIESVNKATGVVLGMSQGTTTRQYIVVTELPLSNYAALATDIAASTRGLAEVISID